MRTFVAATVSALLSGTALGVYVPYCSISAVEGQNYIKWATNPTPGVTGDSLCEIAESELRYQYHLTPTGARSWGYIDNYGQNYAWIKCNDNYVQYVNAFGLNIVDVANQMAGNHFQCLFHINHNG